MLSYICYIWKVKLHFQDDIDNVHLLGLIFDFTPNNCDQVEFNSTPIECNQTATAYLSITFDHAVKLTRVSDFMIVKMKNGDRWIPVMVRYLQILIFRLLILVYYFESYKKFCS